ncbi:hypothetical protein L226DRAFT_608011 [Lentinus tigrinus ALCF2SS1-7]|uniref:F-box domain-containing protein n=1 Tax=Lentinus tigrinus ALCF2SS1-6 TaxID=1328759 RepID=A0A5C2T2Z1_9APHY|nr:hypothetical protein L227DRAFT_568927 [Lentinus tigrinus ALCF2SS1-6]RPD80647.1 hypothetical protein L226DRAFT_608011 [Lentinus tigrinus ALCF2SS1-7]
MHSEPSEDDSDPGPIIDVPVEEGDSRLDTPEQRELREQIAFHVAQAARLKRDLNSCNRTVIRLPPEILAEVFMCQAAILRKERVALHVAEGETEIHKSFYQWLNVAQVCHHWREIALNCANLWTWIAFEERIRYWYIQNLVKRTRGLPLTVVLTVNGPGLHCDSCIDPDTFYHNASCALDLVKELLPRTRELLIFVQKDFDTDNIWDAFDGPSPLLETLRVEALPGARFNQGDTHAATVRLPAAVFGLQAPRLQSIYVAGIRVYLSSPIFGASLRKLVIVSCQCSPLHVVPDFVRWQSMLRRMPLLEELSIDWSVPFGNDGVVHDPVSLPHVKELRISADVDAFAGHVAYLRTPSTAAIHYHYCPKTTSRSSRESLPKFCAAISTLFKDIFPVRIAYRGRDPHEEDFVSCQIWARPALQQHARPSWTSTIDFLALPERPPRFVIESEFKYDMGLLATAPAETLDMSSVHTVDIGDFSMGNQWAHALRGAQNVQVLRAHGLAAFGVPAILGTADADDIQKFDPADEFQRVSDEVSGEAHGDDPNPEPRSADDDVDMAEPESEVAGPRHDMSGTGTGRTIPLFPNLAVLDFVDLDLEIPGGGYPPLCPHTSMALIMLFQAKKAKYGLSIEAILKCLRMRGEKRAADIASVRFHGCCCTDITQLAPLVEAVPDVLWDGDRISGVSITSARST